LRRSAALIVAGLGAGPLGAAFLGRFVESLLYGVKAFDILTFGSVAVLLAAVALVASHLPARRAASIDPIRALRSE
jgi:putative ABC transport system permease protein